MTWIVTVSLRKVVHGNYTDRGSGPTWPRTHPIISQSTHRNQTHNRAYTQGDDPHIWGEVDTTGGATAFQKCDIRRTRDGGIPAMR